MFPISNDSYAAPVITTARSRGAGMRHLGIVVLMVLAGAGAAVCAERFGLPNAYQRAVLGELAWPIATLAGAMVLMAAGVALSTRRHYRWFVVSVIAVAVGDYSVLQSYTEYQDYFSSPSVVTGIVIGTHMDSPSSTGQDRYVITVGGIDFERGVSRDLYRSTRLASCVTITYGPHSHLLTAIQPCWRTPGP